MRHLSDLILRDNLLHGSLFWLLQGVAHSCRWPWFCDIYGIGLRSQRSRGDEVMSPIALWWLFKLQLWLRLWPRRCIVVADEPFGLTFLDDVGATYAQVSYFIKGLEGRQTGRAYFWKFFCPDWPVWEPWKKGIDTVTADLWLLSIVTCIQWSVHFISHWHVYRDMYCYISLTVDSYSPRSRSPPI